jgi:hypothetical protein
MKVVRMIEKIVSGGQTGADRAALDWAISRDISHEGWCPKGRLAEDGTEERAPVSNASVGNSEARTSAGTCYC